MNIQTPVAILLVLLLSCGRPLLADGAAVWFGPNDDLLRPWKPEQRGPADFMQFFSPEAPWSTAASRVSYLQSNLFGIDNRSDAELDQLIASLRARNIRFAIEDGGLEYDPACGAPVEGDISFATTQRILQRFKQRGGVVDAIWLEQAWQKMLAYELRTPVQPDHAILESWIQHPTRVLPETSPTAHTNLILRYTRPRTYMEVQVEPSQVQGRLVDSADAPVANVPVQLIGKPSAGPGIGYTYARAGTVPAEATTALLALRVNAECRDCQAPVTLQIRGARYTEGEANRVQNLDFTAGLADWGFSGTAQVSTPSGGLSLRAVATQQAMLNSAPFPVTGAADYSMQIDATVAPQSFSGGYFAVIFLGPSGEILREQLPFEATLEAGSALTDSQGRVTLNIPDTGETSMAWSLHFAGDEQLWPSRER